MGWREAVHPAVEVVVGHSCARGVPAGTGSQESLGLRQLLPAEVTSKGKQMDLGLYLLGEIIFFFFFASIPRAFGPDHERRSIFVSLLDFQPFHLKSGLSFN